MAYSAIDVARWFVAWATSDDEAHLTNLKLQKLLYYAQGASFALKGAPMFDDDIQAWAHGPVVPDVYHHYKDFRSGEIEQGEPFDWDLIGLDDAKILVRVWNTYGAKSAWKLRDMTHDEAPWVDHFRANVSGIVIPKEDISVYFKSTVSST